jgi:tRNA (cmo5U34)-methyltransferase
MEKPTNFDPAKFFDRDRAQGYDQRIRRAIPGYEALHSMAATLLQLDLQQDARILIVGAGTGAEILTLSAAHPQWQLMGVDPSSDMMAIAQQQVIENSLGDRVKLHVGFTHELPESELYDAATLMLVMHFVPDNGEKLQLLQSITQRLKPKAPLILADIYGDKTSAQFAHFMAAWKHRLLSLAVPAEKVDEQFQFIMADLNVVPEARTVELLHEVGFQAIERFYTGLMYGGWVACFPG